MSAAEALDDVEEELATASVAVQEARQLAEKQIERQQRLEEAD